MTYQDLMRQLRAHFNPQRIETEETSNPDRPSIETEWYCLNSFHEDTAELELSCVDEDGEYECSCSLIPLSDPFRSNGDREIALTLAGALMNAEAFGLKLKPNWGIGRR